MHQPAGHYCISPSRYPAGTAFSGAALAGRKYILVGSSEITVSGSSWELQAEDIADIPADEYKFHVMGSGPVEFVSVWELPP